VEQPVRPFSPMLHRAVFRLHWPLFVCWGAVKFVNDIVQFAPAFLIGALLRWVEEGRQDMANPNPNPDSKQYKNKISKHLKTHPRSSA
jgi:hypothetical protein